VGILLKVKLRWNERSERVDGAGCEEVVERPSQVHCCATLLDALPSAGAEKSRPNVMAILLPRTTQSP